MPPVRPGTGGALEGLYGAFGNATSQDRQRMYDEQYGALSGQIGRGASEARADAMRGATTASAGGNPFLAGRLGAQAAGQAAGRVQSAGVGAREQLAVQQQQQELQARQQQGQFGQQMVGGLLNAGGQVLGMAVPALGALGGAAGGAGAVGSLFGGGGARGGPQAPQQGGGLLGMLGGGSSPMAPGSTLLGPNGMGVQAPQPAPVSAGGMLGRIDDRVAYADGHMGLAQPGPAPPGMRWDATTNQWVPA